MIYHRAIYDSYKTEMISKTFIDMVDLFASSLLLSFKKQNNKKICALKPSMVIILDWGIMSISFFYMFSIFKVFHSDFASLHLKYVFILRLSSGSLDSRLTLWPGSWGCIDIAGPLVSTQNEIGTNGGLWVEGWCCLSYIYKYLLTLPCI